MFPLVGDTNTLAVVMIIIKTYNVSQKFVLPRNDAASLIICFYMHLFTYESRSGLVVQALDFQLAKLGYNRPTTTSHSVSTASCQNCSNAPERSDFIREHVRDFITMECTTKEHLTYLQTY